MNSRLLVFCGFLNFFRLFNDSSLRVLNFLFFHFNSFRLFDDGGLLNNGDFFRLNVSIDLLGLTSNSTDKLLLLALHLLHFFSAHVEVKRALCTRLCDIRIRWL